MSSRASTLAIVLVVLASSIAAPIAFASTAVAQEDGMVGVPDSNVVEDLPVGENHSLSAEDLEGSVMASENASSLQVIVTTPERSSDYLNGSTVGGSSGVAIVLQDDSNHAGREVALPADAIREAVGHVPEVVRGVHESGERWTAPVEARNGMLFFEVPKFSSNSIVFDGEVRVDATATNGSTYNYNLSSLDGTDDPRVDLTGVTNTEWDNESASVPLSGSMGIEVAGTTAPTGPGGSPTLSLTADRRVTQSDGEGYGAYWIGHLNSEKLSSETTIENPPEKITAIEPRYYGISNDVVVDVYIVAEGADQTYGEGTQVASGVTIPANQESKKIDISNYSVPSGTDMVTVEWVTTSTTGSDNHAYLNYDGSSSPSTAYWTYDSASYSSTYDEYPSVTLVGPPVSGVSATVDSETVQFGNIAHGETVSKNINISLSDSDVTLDGSGSVSASLKLKERTQTENAGLVLNGHRLEHTGTLADGETVTLNGSADWLQTGTNEVVVEVGDGPLSADAPAPKVVMNYSHGASDTVLGEYASTGWRESYNVSHTYSSERSNPTATVEFSREVVDIRHVETRVDDGSWSSVSSDRWSLENGTTLVVDLDDGDGDGNVDAGTEIALRTAGIKVQAEHGSITVVDPTTPGSASLDSEIRVDSRAPGFGIEVSGTKLGDRLHYTHSETWEANEYALFNSAGDQLLRLPDASSGETFRVTTVPLGVDPDGDVSVHVANADGPTFSLVGSGEAMTGDAVTFRYFGGKAGSTYELYSVSRGRPVAKATAGAEAAVFEHDDSQETFRIRLAENSSSDGTSGDDGVIGSAGTWEQAGPDSTLQEGLVVAGWAALVVLLVAATGRSSIRGRSRWVLVGSVGAGSGLLFVEVLRPGTISTAISGGLQEVVPLAGLAGIGIVGYVVYSWWQTRRAEASTPETSVEFELGRRK